MSSPKQTDHPLYTANDLGRVEGDEAEAESHLVASLEDRRSIVQTSSGENYGAAVPGEQALLGNNVKASQMYNVFADSQGTTAKNTFKSLVKKSTQKTNRLRGVVLQALQEHKSAKAMQTNTAGAKHGKHDVQTILKVMQEDAKGKPFKNQDPSMQAQPVNTRERLFNAIKSKSNTSHTDRLMAGAFLVQNMYESDDRSTMSETSSDSRPLLHENEAMPLLQQQVDANAGRRRSPPSCCCKMARSMQKGLVKCCRSLCNGLLFMMVAITHAYFVFMAIPLFVMEWILFYELGNPSFDFLPDGTTLSWWCNFFGRQLLTLELARICEWLIIDVLTLSTKIVIQLGGPLTTLLAIQSKGWPFLCSAWACIDFLMLHGDNKFQRNWLYWTGLRIYSNRASSIVVLNSDTYSRAVFCLLLVGVATSLKRTFMAIRFGRKTFVEFKPRLEKLLKDICLVAEIAEMAENLVEMIAEKPSIVEETPDQRKRRAKHMAKKTNPLERSVGTVQWKTNTNEASADDDDDDDDDDSSDDEKPKDTEVDTDELSRSDSGSLRIKNLLERWEEPISKLDKSSEGTIQDVLQFRRALELMDETHPFGLAYGPASTRDDCIMSAHSVYWKLMKLTPRKHVLPYETLAFLLHASEESEKDAKSAALMKLFHPDRDGQVPLLAFVQACDSLYRRLRYFRASVGNASAIDLVLADVFDSVFGFILFLVAVSILNFNPWPLLVSMSTLIVSFSFAVGSSASRYIEGVLLIAVRRPYDLGDRVIITGVDTLGSPGVTDSWFIEDINLYFTTLRFGRTNEVCTIANGNLSGYRVINCTRSPAAIVVLQLDMHLAYLDDDNMAAFEKELKLYCDDNPRDWEAVLYHRVDNVDANNERVTTKLALRHHNGWMSASRIMRDKGEVLVAIYKICDKLKINYEMGVSSVIQYQGGTIKSSYFTPRYSKDALTPANIKTLD